MTDDISARMNFCSIEEGTIQKICVLKKGVSVAFPRSYLTHTVDTYIQLFNVDPLLAFV